VSGSRKAPIRHPGQPARRRRSLSACSRRGPRA